MIFSSPFDLVHHLSACPPVIPPALILLSLLHPYTASPIRVIRHRFGTELSESPPLL